MQLFILLFGRNKVSCLWNVYFLSNFQKENVSTKYLLYIHRFRMFSILKFAIKFLTQKNNFFQKA